MEIGQIGSAALSGSTVKQATGELSEVAVTKLKAKAAAGHAASHAAVHSRGRALNMLRLEIRQLLAVNFRLGVVAPLPGYSGSPDDLTPEEVAADALLGARRIAEGSPLDASESLAEFRDSLEASASDVREASGDDDFDDIDDAIARVGDGLDELEQDAARNVESSATILSAETLLKQRSTIRIRTQEGDIVRLDLRRAESLSASDIALTDGATTVTSTAVELSGRSRMMLSVNGDLNEAEFAAIQNVFLQAQAIADEFFNGDIAAAFDMSNGLEFDTEQLARVNLRFREQQVSRASFAAIGLVQPEPAQIDAPALDTVGESVVTDTPATTAAPVAIEPDAPVVAEPETVAAEPGTAAVTQTDAPVAVEPDGSIPAQGAIAGFFQLLADFLQAVNEGFELETDTTSFRYFYSQSFNLEILKTVLQVSAPEESEDAATTATVLIDNVTTDVEEA